MAGRMKWVTVTLVPSADPSLSRFNTREMPASFYTGCFMTCTLQNLAEAIDAELIGDGSKSITGCASIETAGNDQVTFIANPKYARFLATTDAAAVIVGRNVADTQALAQPDSSPALLVSDDPYFAFRNVMIKLHGFREHPQPTSADGSTTQQSELAAIHPDAEVDATATVHPFVVIEKGATIGPRSVIYPHVYVGPNATVGDDAVLHTGVVVYDRCQIGNRVTLHANTVIGQDGFGYATHNGVHEKIPQHGIVVIEDDVEIGASCAIERAAMGETRIGRGTKFADLISIGHGTTVGEGCLFVSLVGVSGSVKVGKYVVLGGQSGVAGHLEVGDFVQAAGRTAIVTNVEAGKRVGGAPSTDFYKAKRNAKVALELSQLANRVRQLEKQLAALADADQEKQS